MIIITGASRGIGRYLFKRYSELGYDVMGTYNGTESDIKGYTKVDITDLDQVHRWIADSLPNLNEVTLINCAGITYNSFAHKANSESWNKVIDVNLKGTFNCINAVLPLMRNQQFGRIINFSSVVASKGTKGVSAYAASKSALWGLVKSVAQENAGLGITINNISMGYSELGMIDAVPEKFLEMIKQQIPAGRLCESSDIFLTVEYLRNCSYVNGASLDLNGGLF